MPIVTFYSTVSGQIYIDVGNTGSFVLAELGVQYDIPVGTTVAIDARPDTGYLFDCWRSYVTKQYYEAADPWLWTPTAATSPYVTMEAVFYLATEPPPPRLHRVGIAVGVGGEVTPVPSWFDPGNPTFIIVEQNTAFTLTATSNAGYEFVHFITTGGTIFTANPWTYNIGQWGLNVTAVFQLEVQTVQMTILAGVGGSTNPVPGTYVADVGVEYIITAIPDVGYYLKEWLLNGAPFAPTGPNEFSIVPYDDFTLQPVFSTTPPPPPIPWGIILIGIGVAVVLFAAKG